VSPELFLELMLAGLAVTAGVAVFGPELVIVLALLAATGLVPFVDPTAPAVGSITVYLLLFGIAIATMLAVWCARMFAGKPSWPLRPNVLIYGTLALLGYVILAMVASDPLSQPSLAAPFVEFPLMAIVTYLWLSHEEALTGVRRVLPFAVAIVTAWMVSYIAGSGGCGLCRDAVGADIAREGLIGPHSRLYTAGQNTLLALVLVCFGQTLRRPTPLNVGLTVLGIANVALQASRTQYIGLFAGMAVLVGWKLWQLRATGKLALVAVTAVAVVGILNSPVGERTLTSYEDISQKTGTGGYRLGLVEQTSGNWSTLGRGIGPSTLDLGLNFDLGLPNTLLVLGFVGAALQIAVLLLALMRSISARTLAGATLASVFVLVLVARPTLPLIEYGHSTIAYGAAIGFAAWLFADRPRRGGLRPLGSGSVAH
jgi:hypothetical protein